MIYESQCPDIFQGGLTVSIKSILSPTLNPKDKEELQEKFTFLQSGESVLRLTADYAWVLVALAKVWHQEEEILPVVKERWENIKAEKESKKEVLLFTSKNTEEYIYWSSIYRATEFFIDKSIEEFDNGNTKESIYNPYGFITFIGLVLNQGYEHLVILSDDITTSFDSLYKFSDEMVNDIIDVSIIEYEKLIVLRNKLAIEMDGISKSISMYKMLDNLYTIKTFRNKLAILIKPDMLIINNTSKNTYNELDKLLSDIMSGKISKSDISIVPIDIQTLDNIKSKNDEKKNKYDIPEDINEFFDR